MQILSLERGYTSTTENMFAMPWREMICIVRGRLTYIISKSLIVTKVGKDTGVEDTSHTD